MHTERKNLKTRRIIKGKSIVISVIIIAAAVAAVLFAYNGGLGGRGTLLSYGADSKAAYRPYSGGAIQYTKDGASFYSKSGEQLWNDAYSMVTPLVVERGDYTAIFETDGRSVRVYNNEGLVYNVQTSDTILSVSLAENGYTGVITSGDSYMVSVYSASGSLLFQRIEADSGIYPICCDVTPKGNIVAISYMDTTGVEIKTKIGMFYVDAEEGADYTDSMFSAIEKENEIIFKMFFLSDNELAAIGDRHILTISSSGVEESSLEITNEITGIGLCGKKIAIAYGDELPDKEGQPAGTVIFISSGGKMSAGDSIGREADYFSSSKSGVVLGAGSVYFGIGSGGSLQWTLNTSGNVTGIYPTSSVNKCIYATRTWSVEADMRNFDTASYDSSIVKTIAVNENTENNDTQNQDSQNETNAGDTGSTEENQEGQNTQGQPEQQKEAAEP